MITDALTAPAPRTAQRLAPGRRVYAIGDVHGHLDKLAALHGAIRRDLRDRPVASPLLVHLGDLIDRGPDSAGCVALLAAGPPLRGVPTVNLMGNHENMMLMALDRRRPGDKEHWLANGGDEALASWGIPASIDPAMWPALIPPAHLAFLRGLQMHHIQDRYLFVHAGVQPGIRLAQQRRSDLLWIRQGFLDWGGPMLPEDPGLVIVHGHTPRPRPEVRANRIGVDTGAGQDGPLTCAVLEGADVRFMQECGPDGPLAMQAGER